MRLLFVRMVNPSYLSTDPRGSANPRKCRNVLFCDKTTSCELWKLKASTLFTRVLSRAMSQLTEINRLDSFNRLRISICSYESLLIYDRLSRNMFDWKSSSLNIADSVLIVTGGHFLSRFNDHWWMERVLEYSFLVKRYMCYVSLLMW